MTRSTTPCRFPLHMDKRLDRVAGGLCSGLWLAALARLLAEWQPQTLIILNTPLILFGIGLFGGLSGLTLLRRWTAGQVWPLTLAGLYLAQPYVSPLWGAAALIGGLAGTLWLMDYRLVRPALAEHLCSILAFVIPLILYLNTLSPSVLPGDSGEFQFVVPTLGIPHPTGYPLYLILGRLFTLLPVGTVAWRLNLFSAVAAAGAVWAAYRVGRAMGWSCAAACIAAALLMVSETFWSQAVIAEKYALNAFFVAMTLWLGLEWRKTRERRWLYLWAACYGLSLTHHRTMLMLAPAYALLVWLTDRAILRRSALPGLIILFLAPLSLYLALPLFNALNPPYAYIRLDSLQAFIDLVLARSYQSGLFLGGWVALPGRLGELGRLLMRQFGPWGLALSLGGWAALWLNKRVEALILVVGMAAQAAFALNYYVPNTPVYYLPVYVWLAVCAGAMVEWVSDRVAGPRQAVLVWTALVAALPLYLGITHLPGMDQKRAYAGQSFDHEYGRRALQSVEPHALIVSDWLPATVLWYAQYVDGLAATAQIVAVDSLEGQWQGHVETALNVGRPVYLARPVTQAAEQYALSSAGPLLRVQKAPSLSAVVPSTPTLDMGDPICLLTADLSRSDAAAQAWVTLHWQTTLTPTADYAVTLRIIDHSGYVWVEKQSRHPVGASYPTSRWRAGQIVTDTYRLTWPPYLPSGEYRLQAAIGLPLTEPVWQEVETIEIRKPARWPFADLSTPLRRAVGSELVLLGHDAPNRVVAGETISLSLLWLVRRPPTSLPAMTLIAQDGTSQMPEPIGENVADWQPGHWVMQTWHFEVTETLRHIEVGVGNHRYRLPWQAAQAAPPLADFGGLIRLRGYRYEKQMLGAGETVNLTLEWEAAKAIPEPYKVFVHVLGTNGLPIAQQDNEPLNGSYPTTRWKRGERVSDPYSFALPADLPPGRYQVEVGLYRLSDMGRLPVLNADQSVVDDKVFLETLEVIQP